MQLHLVTGFLGAGKTTSIINCCKHLMLQGKTVAVITNDQGKYLVDTAFIRAADIPSTEVQSGCFCSHYQDMVKQLDDLKDNVDPDIVFAEAIGSAANLVGSVMQPLIEGSDHHPDSLSAIVDARLMLRLIKGYFLPFSDSVSSTFKAQIRESNFLIINKFDLLSKVDINTLKDELVSMYPHKRILLQSAQNNDDIINWYQAISSETVPLLPDNHFDAKAHSLALDKLVWEEKVRDYTDENNVFPTIIRDLETLLSKLRSQNAVIAHIKAFIEFESKNIKISITALDKTSWKNELSKLYAKKARMMLNIRVQK